MKKVYVSPEVEYINFYSEDTMNGEGGASLVIGTTDDIGTWN